MVVMPKGDAPQLAKGDLTCSHLFCEACLSLISLCTDYYYYCCMKCKLAQSHFCTLYPKDPPPIVALATKLFAHFHFRRLIK
jgi:hypothetical protein